MNPPEPPVYVQGVTLVDINGAILQEQEINFSDSARLSFNNDDEGHMLVVKADKPITSLTILEGPLESPTRVDDNTFDVMFTTAPVNISGIIQVTLQGWPPVEVSVAFGD